MLHQKTYDIISLFFYLKIKLINEIELFNQFFNKICVCKYLITIL